MFLYMKALNYRVLLRKEREGGYIVPSLPGCVTYREDIELYIESLKAHGEKIPDENNISYHLGAAEANGYIGEVYVELMMRTKIDKSRENYGRLSPQKRVVLKKDLFRGV